jgi:hypothetical protein
MPRNGPDRSCVQFADRSRVAWLIRRRGSPHEAIGVPMRRTGLGLRGSRYETPQRVSGRRGRVGKPALRVGVARPSGPTRRPFRVQGPVLYGALEGQSGYARRITTAPQAETRRHGAILLAVGRTAGDNTRYGFHRGVITPAACGPLCGVPKEAPPALSDPLGSHLLLLALNVLPDRCRDVEDELQVRAQRITIRSNVELSV